MKTSLLAALGAGILAAGATASSNVAARDTLDAGTASYAFKAKVISLDYDFDWVLEEGDRYGDCTYWSLDRGSTHVHAFSMPVRKRQSDTLIGSITVYDPPKQDRYSRRWQWADGPAVGGMKAMLERRFTHTGGKTGCSDNPPVADPAPRTDCGTRSYKVASAVLMPEVVVGQTTLEELQTSATSPSLPWKSSAAIFAVSAVSQSRSPLYRMCKTTPNAPEFVDALPVGVRSSDRVALLALRPGKSYILHSSLTGPCKRDLAATEACDYTVSAKIEFQRWKPGTKFP